MLNKNIFDEIYSQGSWRSGTSLSGPGSEPENALHYVAFVEEVIKDYGITRILDIGHGDWKMWPTNFFKSQQYIGVDVVAKLNEVMSKDYSTENIRFLLLDATKDSLPDADLVLIKDVLMHLSNKEIDEILKKLKNYSVAIICTDVIRKLTVIDILYLFKRFLSLSVRITSLLRGKNPFFKLPRLQNIDIKSGGHRYLNLEKKPWNLRNYNLDLVETYDFFGLSPKSKQWKCISVKRIYLVKPLK